MKQSRIIFYGSWLSIEGWCSTMRDSVPIVALALLGACGSTDGAFAPLGSRVQPLAARSSAHSRARTPSASALTDIIDGLSSAAETASSVASVASASSEAVDLPTDFDVRPLLQASALSPRRSHPEMHTRCHLAQHPLTSHMPRTVSLCVCLRCST